MDSQPLDADERQLPVAAVNDAIASDVVQFDNPVYDDEAPVAERFILDMSPVRSPATDHTASTLGAGGENHSPAPTNLMSSARVVSTPQSYTPGFATEAQPRTFDEAKTRSDSSLWVAAMQSEMNSVQALDTWYPVERVPGMKVLPVI